MDFVHYIGYWAILSFYILDSHEFCSTVLYELCDVSYVEQVPGIVCGYSVEMFSCLYMGAGVFVLTILFLMVAW